MKVGAPTRRSSHNVWGERCFVFTVGWAWAMLVAKCKGIRSASPTLSTNIDCRRMRPAATSKIKASVIGWDGTGRCALIIGARVVFGK